MKQKNVLFMWLAKAKGSSVAVGIAVLVFFFWNCLAPEFVDDYVYKYMIVQGFGKDKVDMTHLIQSFSDVLVSQWNHYFSWNGRSLVHVLAQTFTSLLGKGVFDVCNTLVFGAFLVLLLKYMGKAKSLCSALIVIVLVLLLPSFSATSLWMTGSLNYLWPSLALLGLLLYYDAHKGEKAAYPGFLLPLLGAFCAGWTHEGLTFPLALSLWAFSCYRKDFSFHRKGFPLVVAFSVGMLLCVLSPGILHRASVGASDGPVVSFSLKSILLLIAEAFVQLRLFYVMLFFLFWTWKKHNAVARKFFKGRGYLVVAVALAFVPIVVSRALYGRVLYGMEFYALLVILYLLPKIFSFSKRTETKISVVLFILLMAFVCAVSVRAVDNYKDTQKLLSQLQRKAPIIATSEYNPSLLDNYVRTVYNSNLRFVPLGEGYICDSRYLKALYHYPGDLYFVPETIVRKMKTEDASLNEFDVSPENFCYVKRLPRGAKVEEVKVLLRPTDFDALPFWWRPIARHYGRYTYREYNEPQFTVVPYGKYSYLLVGKNDLLKDRVKRIVVR